MKTQWQLQEAKNKFSEVIDLAISAGPQEITRHGKQTAVILSFEEYKRLQKKTTSLGEFFQRSPLHGMALERKKDIPRNLHL
jgi:prevent-host-death family protein